MYGSVSAFRIRIPRSLLYAFVACSLIFGVYSIGRTVWFEYGLWSAGESISKEDFEAAGRQLAFCIRMGPESGRARFLAAQVARRTDQVELAEEQLLVCADLGWPAEALQLERAMLAFQQGNGDHVAEEMLLQCNAPGAKLRPLALEALARGYTRTYRLLPALECLNTLITIEPHMLAARLRRAWVYERLNRLGDAETDYQDVLRIDPESSNARLSLAQILRQQGKTTEAAVQFEQLIADRPRSIEVRLNLARCYLALAREREARVILSELIQEQPENWEAFLESGRANLASGETALAQQQIETASALAPQEYEPLYQLYLCYSRLGADEKAEYAKSRFEAIEADLRKIGTLTEQLQTDPDDTDLRFEIAQIFAKRGEDSEAAVWCEGVLKISPDHQAARSWLITYYDRAGNAELARMHREYKRRK